MQLPFQPCIGRDEWNHPLLYGFESCLPFIPNHPSEGFHSSSSALAASASLTTVPQHSVSAAARLPARPQWKSPLLKTDAHQPPGE